ncbi:hypothetical protein M3557_07840 [Bhargavaea ginsengi]|uniref:hypothetical protein n=1 Tax=Bhargavaea ginsengi TaxID=426757 RepID=UPI002042296A|nr:hypothetical protein [Bhargavaea ginsengi]MCM3087818.1 hypothetical protein [Bhargavaea ginsengi]
MEHSMSLRQATSLFLRVLASKFILTSGQQNTYVKPVIKPSYYEMDKSGAEVLKPRRWM